MPCRCHSTLQGPNWNTLSTIASHRTLTFDTLAAPLLTPIAAARGIRQLLYDQFPARQPAELPDIAIERHAMILYSRGTTSRPKSVVTTHANIAAHVKSVVEAWEWSADDRIVCVCPCTRCTESSTLSRVRCGPAQRATCCRASTRMPCGTVSPAAMSLCSWRCRRFMRDSSRLGTRLPRSAARP